MRIAPDEPETAKPIEDTMSGCDCDICRNAGNVHPMLAADCGMLSREAMAYGRAYPLSRRAGSRCRIAAARLARLVDRRKGRIQDEMFAVRVAAFC